MKFAAALDDAADRLDDLGAEPGEERRQRDVYFAAPHRDFAATDEALRVRRVDGEARTTYKGAPRGGAAKTREEIEVGVDDGDAMAAIYEALGFEAVATVAKHRREYRLDGVTVCLDEVEDLGSYVELEATGPDGDRETLEEELRAAAEALDVPWEDGVRRSYLEMLLEEP